MEEKEGGLQAKGHHPNREARGWQHHVVRCFAAGGTGALHKIDGIMRMESYVDILKKHLKTSVRKSKLGRKWVFQMNNVPKQTSKIVAKWLKGQQSQGIGVAITKP